MIIKKFQAKTEEAALELARKELGSGIVVMNLGRYHGSSPPKGLLCKHRHTNQQGDG